MGGLSGNPANNTAALILYWNGSAWLRMSSPNPPNSGELLGVAAASAGDAWAVSGAAGQAIGTNKTVIDHWNGRAWKRVPSPNPVPGGAILTAAAATSASDAWAVGTDTDFVTSFENVIEHWDGTGAAKDLLGGIGGVSHRSRVFGVVVRVAAARLERGIVARRRDAVGGVVGGEFLEGRG